MRPIPTTAPPIPATTAPPLLSFTQLAKAVPDGSMALRQASGTVYSGEFLAIVGPSGSGKTTLLSLLGLLDHPLSGSYALDQVDTARLTEPQRNQLRGDRIGFVFQNSYLVADQSAGDNVDLGLRVRGVPAEERRQLAVEALAQVGLADSIDKRAGDLSGGEKQRVAIARALATKPDVILADEPSGALDVTSTSNLIALLRQINQQGTTVIVVTHDPLVSAAADRSVTIEDGILQADRPAGPSTQCANPPVTANPSAASSSSPTTSPDARLDSASPISATPIMRRSSRPNRPQGSTSTRLFQEVRDAAIAPLHRPLRSLLVLLAYVMGVAALVGASGIMASTTGQIVNHLTSAASSQIRVARSDTTSTTWAEFFNTTKGLHDLEGVDTTTPVRTFAPVSNPIARVVDGQKSPGSLTITDSEYLRIHGLTPASGRTELLDNSWNGAVVVVGAQAAQTLGLATAAPGVSLTVNSRPVDVAAILAPSGDTVLDSGLYFSQAAEPYLVDPLDSYVLVRCLPGYAEPLAKAIPAAINPINPGQVAVSTVAELAGLQQSITTDLGDLLTIIGWVILGLSTLAASTSMLLSVQSRRAEIALRRSMGSPRAAIWRLFAYEGLFIGLAGGSLGSAAGIGLSSIVAATRGWPLCLGLHLPITGIIVGVVAGVLAAVIPALVAATRHPASILRTV